MIRWTPQRKADLALKVLSNEISAEQAATQYALSPEELDEWVRRSTAFGIEGLRIKNTKQLRV